MNHEQAFIKGANAFLQDKPRQPYRDPHMHPYLCRVSADNLKSWLEGWDKANLEHVESDIMEHEAAAKAEALNEQILTHGPYRPDPEAEHEEARERWLENLELDQATLNQAEANNSVCDSGIKFNKDGSITLSADWIMRNAE